VATGAGDQYWEQQMLPSVLNHDLLRRYLPRFAGKTGTRAVESGEVVLTAVKDMLEKPEVPS
jgi:hypothetical protein